MATWIERVPPHLVSDTIPTVRMWMEEALKRARDETVEDVVAQVTGGDAELWLAYADSRLSGVFVTSIFDSRSRRILELRYLAGRDLRKWIVSQPALVEWARARGCDVIQLRGRPGWTRFLPRFGWKVTAYEMELAL